MRGAVMYAPGDVRVEDRDAPRIVEPTDALIRVSAACVCGSDLWPYRGVGVDQWPMPMGHEYVGIVEEVGAEVRTVRPGQFVVGSFWATDNTCEICRAGYQSACVDRVPMGALGAQAELLRVPLADGTLVATPGMPPDDLVPSLLSASDVLGTGWFGAVAAEAGPGKTVAVVGDGAVGLLAVLAAKQLGAERIIAMSRHESRQRLAREFGATDIVEARGDAGVAAIKELADGLGAHSVVEAVGTQESMNQALHATRAGGHVGFVGVAHDVSLDGMDLFWSLAHVHGGPAPVRRFLPELIDLVWRRQIDPGKVFDLELPLEEAAAGYRAMDQREAIKTLLRPRSNLEDLGPNDGGRMQITRSSIETQKGPADWFTGDVYIDAVAVPEATSTIAAALVHFTPGARTAWHTHPHGQTIFVTEGVGLCQREGGPVETIRPGDRVFFEPGENHWHGAAPHRFMVHLAMQQSDESGSPVSWGEHVSDEQYAGRDGSLAAG